MNDVARSSRPSAAAVRTSQRAFDAVVIGGDLDGLTAATRLASRGAKVLLLEEGAELGGTLREVEFAPGFRCAPLAPPRDPSVLVLGEQQPLLLELAAAREAVARTTDALERSAPADAARWAGFISSMHACAGFLETLYRAPPPRIDADSAGEFLSLLAIARRFRRLGRQGMTTLLRVLPMPIADLLDDELGSDEVKGALAALAVTDLAQSPAAAGTAFTFLHRQVVIAHGVRSGEKAIDTMLARARAAGVVVETGKAVGRLRIREGRVTGVVLASGEEIACSTVISSLHPYRSLLELIDAKHHDPEFVHAVRNVRFRGVTTKVLLALDGLPSLPGGLDPERAFKGSAVIAPDVRYVERAYEASKYGRCSEEPFVELRVPSLAERHLAPGGKHVAVLHVQYTPYRLREGTWNALRQTIAERAIATVERRLPGFTARVQAHAVLTPSDLETTYGLREGAVSQGEMALDQILFMRPVPDASRYATPIEGYFICGAGTHPGAGLHGISGALAAAASRESRRARVAHAS